MDEDVQSQTLYALVYPSRLFAAHWSLWVPDINSKCQELDTGIRIHVTGDRLNGFQYEYIPDYNISEDSRRPNAYAIGVVNSTHLSKSSSDGLEANRATFNALDEACREVEAPSPSLNKVIVGGNGTNTTVPAKKLEIRDCQWWIKQVVAHLAKANILLPQDAASSPVMKVESLPQH